MKISRVGGAGRLMKRTVAVVLGLGMSALSGYADHVISVDTVLTEDTDWSAEGTVVIEAGAKLDLNGHLLTVAGLAGSGMLTNSATAYVILPYIQSSGTQYIDTGYQHDGTTVVDLKAQFPTVPTRGNWFTLYGSRESVRSVNQFGATMNNTNGNNPRHYFITSSAEAQTDIPVLIDTDYIYHLVKNGQSTLNSQVVETGSGGSSGYNDYLFCNNDVGRASSFATMRLYYCQIHSGETLVRDFVPAKRRIDAALGLLDKANNVFYANAGTGVFTTDPAYDTDGQSGIVLTLAQGAVYNTSSLTVAEDVVATAQAGALSADVDWRGFGSVIFPSGTKVDLNTYRLYLSGLSGAGEITAGYTYEELTYIQSSGTQYINTGYQHDGTTVVDLKAQFPAVPAKGKWFTVYGGRDNYKTSGQFGVTMNNTNGNNPRHYFITSSREVQTDIPVEVNTDYIYHLAKNGETTLNSQFIETSTGGSAGRNDYIFCNNHNNTAVDYATMRLYYCQIRSGETLVRNFLPVKRVSDSKVGLFDTVTHAFYENNGTGNFTAGAVAAGSPLNGELHIDVPAGKEVDNTTVLISGKVRLFKDGEGRLIASKYPQTYQGGTDIVGGTLKAASGNINQQDGKSYFGERRILDVRPGGALDPNGGYYWGYHTINLYGGSIHNTGLSPRSAFNCPINLYADSAFITDVDFNYGTEMNLNGHTLTVTIADGAAWHTYHKYNNGKVVVQGGTFQVRDTLLKATDCVFDISSKVEIKYAFTADDLILRNNEGSGQNTAAITVGGTFTPVGGYFPNIVMQDGSTLDLSAKEGPWSVVSQNDCSLSFAANATVTFALGQRQVANPQVVAWIDAPAGVDTLTPLCDQEKASLEIRENGIYLSRPGLTILVR